jgi:cytochrome c-type biogenesis protein CcmH
MKAVVREQLAAGRTPDEVKDYFVDKYGEWILLRPKASGWNALVYVLPLLALVIGGAVVARVTRRWSRTGGQESGIRDQGVSG